MKYLKTWLMGMVAFVLLASALVVSYAHAMPAQPVCSPLTSGYSGPALQEGEAFCHNYPDVPVTTWTSCIGTIGNVQLVANNAAGYYRVIVGALASCGPDVNWGNVAQTRFDFDSQFHIEAYAVAGGTSYGIFDGNNAQRYSVVL